MQCTIDHLPALWQFISLICLAVLLISGEDATVMRRHQFLRRLISKLTKFFTLATLAALANMADLQKTGIFDSGSTQLHASPRRRIISPHGVFSAPFVSWLAQT